MPNDKQGYVYIMASAPNGTIYVGVTSDLAKRVYEHKNHTFKGYTDRYRVDKLVYYEVFDDIYEAIKREKNMKAWKRLWKLSKINEFNPEWKDLYESIIW